MIPWTQIIPYLLSLLDKGKGVAKRKGGVLSFRGIVLGLLTMLFMSQQKQGEQLAVGNKNTDTLKIELRQHLKDYEGFKSDIHQQMVEVGEDIKAVDRKADHNKQEIGKVQEKYSDEIIKILRRRYGQQ